MNTLSSLSPLHPCRLLPTRGLAAFAAGVDLKSERIACKNDEVKWFVQRQQIGCMPATFSARGFDRDLKVIDATALDGCSSTDSSNVGSSQDSNRVLSYVGKCVVVFRGYVSTTSTSSVKIQPRFYAHDVCNLPKLLHTHTLLHVRWHAAALARSTPDLMSCTCTSTAVAPSKIKLNMPRRRVQQHC